jgi:hypothetical protein
VAAARADKASTTASFARHPQRAMFRPTVFIVALALPLLAACNLGGDSAEQVAARKEAEGKAVGAACRHAGRAIEECFSLNKRADKAAVFAGWREMNDYMRDNKVETVPAPAASESTAKADAPAAEEPAKGKASAKAKKTES